MGLLERFRGGLGIILGPSLTNISTPLSKCLLWPWSASETSPNNPDKPVTLSSSSTTTAPYFSNTSRIFFWKFLYCLLISCRSVSLVILSIKNYHDGFSNRLSISDPSLSITHTNISNGLILGNFSRKGALRVMSIRYSLKFQPSFLNRRSASSTTVSHQNRGCVEYFFGLHEL